MHAYLHWEWGHLQTCDYRHHRMPSAVAVGQALQVYADRSGLADYLKKNITAEAQTNLDFIAAAIDAEAPKAPRGIASSKCGLLR